MMRGRIGETDLAELLFPHILDDLITWVRLSQVSRRFNEVAKKKLIRKERIDGCGRKIIWTEFPTGLCRTWYPHGQLSSSINYQHGKRHGLFREWQT